MRRTFSHGSWRVTVYRRRLRLWGEVYHSGYGWAETWAWTPSRLKQRVYALIGEFEGR
jgi:hypothetical protein